MNVIAVMILGAIGGILRFSLETFGVAGTLLVNLIGSFALGLFAAMLTTKEFPSWIRNGVGAGLIGSFTTFSSFANDTVQLMANGLALAALYVVVSVVGGIILCYAGAQIGKLRVHSDSLKQQSQDNQQGTRDKGHALVKSSRT